MGRLNRDSERVDGKAAEAKAGPSKNKMWARWLLGPAAAGAIAVAGVHCTVENYMSEPPMWGENGGNSADGGHTTDGGGGSDGGVVTDGGQCTPQAPVCLAQTVSGLMHGGDLLHIGDYSFRLDSTDEEAGEQRAILDLLDSCNAPILTAEPISEDTTKIIVVVGTEISMRVSAQDITIGDQSARLSVTMVCPNIGPDLDGGLDGGEPDASVDGGELDAGPDADSGTGGDGGADAGLDGGGGFDAGPIEDGGAEEDGGVSDAGPVSDGGAEEDAGPVADGGGLDAGPVGDGGAQEDGGTVADGGPVEDGGASDGGSSQVCAEATLGYFSGMMFSGSPQTIGGYVFEYLGESPSGDALIDISCGGLSVVSSHAFPEDIQTVLVDAGNNKSIRVTPHSLAADRTKITIEIENL